MIAAPAWLLSNWRAIGALLIVGVMSGLILYYRGEAAVADAATARAQRDLEAMRGAYLLLAASVQRQNAAMQELEAAGKEAAAIGARARAEASGAIDVAMRSAEALSRRMREPAGTNCPAGEGLAVVREDWRR